MRTTDVCPIPRKRCRHPASARLPARLAHPFERACQRVRTTFHDALPRFGDPRLASSWASSTPPSAPARATSDAPVAPRIAATNARRASSKSRDRLAPARVNARTLPRPGTPLPCSPSPIARRGMGAATRNVIRSLPWFPSPRTRSPSNRFDSARRRIALVARCFRPRARRRGDLGAIDPGAVSRGGTLASVRRRATRITPPPRGGRGLRTPFRTLGGE